MLVAGQNALNAAPVVPLRVMNKVAPAPKVAAVPKVAVVKKAIKTTIQAKSKAKIPDAPVPGSSHDPPKARRGRKAKKAESSASESEEYEEEEDEEEDEKGRHTRVPFKGCKQIM